MRIPYFLKFLIASLLSITASGGAFGQISKFRHLTVDDGLPMNTVSTIVQDSGGFIWFGTPDGLCRYDGYKLRVFRNDPADSGSISFNSVKFLMVDKKNNLWIGTRQGLNRFDPVTEKFTIYRKDSLKKNWISENNITCLLEYEDKIYIGTFGGGINIFDPAANTFTVIRNIESDPNSLPDDNVRGMSVDKSGNLWAALHSRGLVQIDKTRKKITHYTMASGLGNNELRNVFVDSKDRVWISCWVAGINLWEKGVMHFSRDTSSWLHAANQGLVSMFAEDKEGRIWMATAERGIACYDPKLGKTINFESNPEDPNSISDKTVFSLLIDKSGIIWSGTWNGGVNVYDPRAHEILHFKSVLNNPNSINSNIIWRFLTRKDGKVLIGTSKSVNEFDPDTYKFTSVHADGNIKDAPSIRSIVQTLYEEEDGTLWIGVNGAGLYRYDPVKKTYKVYVQGSDSNSLSYHTVYKALKDLNGNLWFATTGGGLNRYNKETDDFSVFYNDPAKPESLASDIILHMLLRKDGRFWVATSNGLDLFDPMSCKAIHFKSDPKDSATLTENGVNTLYYSKNGLLWIGTGAGLCSYDETTGLFTRYTPKNSPLPDDEITCILDDEKENIWFSTNKGLFIFNPVRRAVRKLEPADGIQSRQFTVNCAMKDDKGRLYFGGVNGFNIIDPEKVTINPSLPEVMFTRFTVLNQPYELDSSISFKKNIVLAYSDYFFSLEFSALEFSDPTRNSYRYFLEGFSKEWVDLGTTRFVTFTNLSPGDYVLKIRASNNHGKWNEKSTYLYITITPPFYMTKWFYALCIAMLIAGIYGFIRWREKKLVEEKQVLESTVHQRTKELREEKEKVDAAHKDIKDSINYAKRIQEAILPLSEEIRRAVPDSFLLFKPRDVVSGDFYWLSEQQDSILIAAADCTGHGVPGALMSMIGSGTLNQVVNEKKISDPGEILKNLNEDIRIALKQKNPDSETRDGMDIALIRIYKEGNTVEYAGANRPLYYIRRDGTEVEEIKADKFPIGGMGEETRMFHTRKVTLNKGDILFIFTDGFADQFGGGTGKKFMTKNFKRLIVQYKDLDMSSMMHAFEKEFEHHRGDFEQVDDILVIGIRV